MEKSIKIGPQIYGYTVCLVSIITFLISITAFVNAIINIADPLHSGSTPQGSPSLASFENYKMDILKTSQKGDEQTKGTFIPDDQTLRAMYEAAKSDKIQFVRHNSNGSLIVSGLLLIICIVLFITHWRWMKNISKSDV
jgi:hypothetical protein